MVQQASTVLHFNQKIDIAVPASGTSCNRPEYPRLSRAMPRGNLQALGSF